MQRRGPNPGFLGPLRVTALIATPVASVGSLGFLFHASQRRPPLLMAIFVVWVLAPFVALLFAAAISRRWSIPARATLYPVMVVVALFSLGVYGYDALRPRRAQPAYVYVMVPPASWLFIAVVVPMAALISRRDHRK